MFIKYDGNGTMKQAEKSNLVAVMEVLFFEGVENLLLYKVLREPVYSVQLEFSPLLNPLLPLFHTISFPSKTFSVFSVSVSFSICKRIVAYARV